MIYILYIKKVQHFVRYMLDITYRALVFLNLKNFIFWKNVFNFLPFWSFTI